MSEQREAFTTVEIIRMARQAGLTVEAANIGDGVLVPGQRAGVLQKFAEVVAQAALSSAPSAKPVSLRVYVEHGWGCLRTETGQLIKSKKIEDFHETTYLEASSSQPNLSAAVAAAREQDAQVCAPHEDDDGIDRQCKRECREAIRALQTEDGLAALREFGLKVAGIAAADCRANATRFELAAIVDRVMKGE